MATKLYLPSSSDAPPISPTVSASWTDSASNFVRYRCHTSKLSTANVDQASSIPGGSSYRRCWRQYITPSIASNVTISGSMSGALFGTSSVSGNSYLYIIARVFQSDGVTVRGTLRDTYASDAGYWVTTGDSQYDNATTITTVNALAGDFIVIELGTELAALHTAVTVTNKWHDDNASDYAYTAGDTVSTKNPSIQFSTTITFNAWPSSGHRLSMMGCGI